MSIQKNYAVTVDLSQDGQGISIASTSVSTYQLTATSFLTGPTGDSAYQTWLDQGNVGTEADFILSLKGTPGTNGTNGQGVPTGGTTGQVLVKADSSDYNTVWNTLTKSSIGLSNVDNTSDANKPVSTAQQTALNLKADDSAVLHTTGNETALGRKTIENITVNGASGDLVNLNAPTGSNTLLRGQQNGTERFALFSLNGSTEAVLRSQARLALISNNGGTPKYLYSDLGALYSTSGMDLGQSANPFINAYLTSAVLTNLRVGTSATTGYVLTADSSGNATWQAPTGGGGGGGITRSIVSVTTSTSLANTAGVDVVALIGNGGAPTLPTAVSNTNRYTVKNVHTTNKTLSTTSAQTIDGSSSITLTPNSSVDLISDGSNWQVI